jgi:hypothetical protein
MSKDDRGKGQEHYGDRSALEGLRFNRGDYADMYMG